MGNVFGNSSNTYSWTPPTPPPPSTDPEVFVTGVTSDGITTTINFAFPPQKPTDRQILETTAVFCNGPGDLFSGPDSVINNPSFPKVSCPVPTTRDVYTNVPVTVPASLFIPGKTYTILTVIRV